MLAFVQDSRQTICTLKTRLSNVISAEEAINKAAEDTLGGSVHHSGAEWPGLVSMYSNPTSNGSNPFQGWGAQMARTAQTVVAE